MRRSDLLAPITHWDARSWAAVRTVCDEMGITPAQCTVLIDDHEKTGYEAGHSGCSYVMLRFSTESEAESFLSRARRIFPDVNKETQDAPNGYTDKNDGVSPSSEVVFLEKAKRYIPDEGPSYCVLLDIQNLTRNRSVIPGIITRLDGTEDAVPPERLPQIRGIQPTARTSPSNDQAQSTPESRSR